MSVTGRKRVDVPGTMVSARPTADTVTSSWPMANTHIKSHLYTLNIFGRRLRLHEHLCAYVTERLSVAAVVWADYFKGVPESGREKRVSEN